MKLYHSLYLFIKNRSNGRRTHTLLKNSWIIHKFFWYWYSLYITQRAAHLYGLTHAISMEQGENVLASESQMHYTFIHTIPVSFLQAQVWNCDWSLCSAVSAWAKVSGPYSAVLIQLPLCILLTESGRHQWESCLQSEKLNKIFKIWSSIWSAIFWKICWDLW